MLAALGLAAVAWCALAAPVVAQERQGRISGAVRSGTAGVTLPDGLAVELITLPPAGDPQRQQTALRGGRYQFTVAADPKLTYLVRVLFDGVGYFALQPGLLSPELPAAELDVVVYGTTAPPPPLRIESTVVTVVALDRRSGQLTLVREDSVVNPGDRTYSGDGGGVTLRLPLPASLVAADGNVVEGGGLPAAGALRLDGDRLALHAPLKPGRSVIVTRYLVGYDRARDSYALAVVAPLPTDRIELRVPERFVDDLSPAAGTRRAGRAELEQEPVLVLERMDVAAGESAAAELSGLAGRNAPNPLTERRGAVIGALLALAALAGGFIAARALAARAGGRAANGGYE